MPDLPEVLSEEPQSAWSRIKQSWVVKSMATSIPIFMIPVGICAMVMGENSSRAFTIISGGELVAHVFGFGLALGGLFVVVGIARAETFTEAMGLIMLGAGSLLYSGGVILGLKENGLIAGGMAFAIGVGALGRMFFLTSLAKSMKSGR